jgi:cytochrome b6-f complex iron-sulfur subunit
VCDACETTAPDVFEVQHENNTCIIRPAALDAEFNKPRTQSIIDAAAECPVDVIKFDTIEVEVPDSEVAAKPAAATADAAKPAHDKASPAKPAAPPKPKVVDPAIQALLAATTVRGGNVVINAGMKAMPEGVKALAKLSPDQLPPDARHVKTMEKSKPAAEEGASRRDIVKIGALAAGWGAMAAVTGGSTLAFARFMAPNVLEVEDPKVRCGALSKFLAMAPGEVNEDFKPVKPSGFWIIREEERLAALSIICTHLGCIPSWLPNDRKFKCPCHGSGFKPNGANFEGPAPRPLERFRIYLDGDQVVVDRSVKFLAMGPNDTAKWNDPDAYIPV